MKTFAILASAMLALAAPAWTHAADAPGEAARRAPDNTGVNVRDRDGKHLTPQNQSENAADRELAQKIRRAIVDDDSLSTNAHNVKVITNGGVVTLRGPVKNEQEKNAVAAKVNGIAGVKRLDNQLEAAAH